MIVWLNKSVSNTG